MTKEQQTENLLKLFEVRFSKKQLGFRIPHTGQTVTNRTWNMQSGLND